MALSVRRGGVLTLAVILVVAFFILTPPAQAVRLPIPFASREGLPTAPKLTLMLLTAKIQANSSPSTLGTGWTGYGRNKAWRC